MHRILGFSLAKPKGLILFVVLLVFFVLAYHKVIQRSILNHPEATLHAVQNHCRYMLGKQLGKMPQAEFSIELQRCNDIQIKSVEAAGGVFDPVIVRITLDAQPRPPLGKDVFIFKSADINTRRFNFLSGLSSLVTGHWTFNFYNTYSNTTFNGSF